MNPRRTATLVTLSCALAWGCDPSAGELASEVATVTITPTSGELEVGGHLSISSTVVINGVQTDRQRDWSSSDRSVLDVTRVNDSDTKGSLYGLKPGTATITVSYKEYSAKATFKVIPAPPYVVEVSPATGTLEVGATITLTAIPRHPSLGFNDGTKDIAWTSDNKQIATVVPFGKQVGQVTAVAPGVVRITADVIGDPGGQGSATLLVVAKPVQGCWPVPSAATFKVTKISDPGGFDGTITLGNAGQITVNVSATATPGKIQIVGGGKMNGWNVDKVDVNGSAPSTSNSCAIDLNEGAVFFGPGNHKTRLFGNASMTPGTKLRLQFLNFNTSALETDYELEVVSVK